MRRLVILLILLFAASVLSAPVMAAKACPTKMHKTHRMSMKKMRHSKTRIVCHRVKRVRHHRMAMPAQKGAGPQVIQPVINVPQQAAPTVNVPQQAAPVVNVAAPPANTAITVDTSCIYIVRDGQLLILNKSDLCLRSKVSLDQVGSMAASPSASP